MNWIYCKLLKSDILNNKNKFGKDYTNKSDLLLVHQLLLFFLRFVNVLVSFLYFLIYEHHAVVDKGLLVVRGWLLVLLSVLVG